MSFFPESSLVSACGQKILNRFEYNFDSCAQMRASQHYLGDHIRSEEEAPQRIFSSLALWTRQLFEGVGSPLEPPESTLMKELQRSRPLSPHQRSRMSHSVFGGNGGHSKDTLTVKHWTGKPHAVREVPWSFRLCGDLDRFTFQSLRISARHDVLHDRHHSVSVSLHRWLTPGAHFFLLV